VESQQRSDLRASPLQNAPFPRIRRQAAADAELHVAEPKQGGQ
jgi:hypothetical protein